MSEVAAKQNNGAPVFHAGIHRLAQVVAGWAFVVIFFGGKTKSKEAGLTIPEPFFIKWMPEWFHVENLNAEYTHRVAVGLLTIMMVSLFGWLLVRGQKTAKVLGGVAVLTLICQAVLGALTVHYLTKAQASIPHAFLGQIMVSLAVCLVVVTSKSWLIPGVPAIDNGATTVRRLSVSLVIAMLVQLLLGAALRHDDKGEALRNGHAYIFVWHLIAHIAGALTVTYFMARVIMRVFRDFRDRKELFAPTRLMMMLLGVQWLLGFGAAAFKVLYANYDDANSPPADRVAVATAHVIVGASILATSVVLALSAYRFTTPGSVKTVVSNQSDALGVPA